ncbi:hypothetical protein AaE_014084 [Aphanomyces astaci]|uniref:Uncharacterized protein n=1 Tax=Aphanomyces astaci TaxID=112090 RepID=A0A6A4Z8H4_APHAT|nr:hypothetical protein AaE_014084 [Aphanomyces astaci]
MADNDVDLDALLDDALDDFDDDEVDPVQEAKAKVEAAQTREMENLKDSMAKFLEDAQNPEFQSVLEQAFREMNPDDTATSNGDSLESLLGSLKSKTTADAPAADVDVGVARTLQARTCYRLSLHPAEDMEGLDTNKTEEMGEEMMQEMMKQFEQMGEKNDFQGLVDGMMQQLLSRDVMYDPMKQICDKYPEWLAEKEPHLSKQDYERYGKQYQYFQQILAVYENEPDNYARLSELMQEVNDSSSIPWISRRT